MFNLKPETEAILIFILAVLLIFVAISAGVSPNAGILVICFGLYFYLFKVQRKVEIGNLFKEGLREYQDGNYKKAGALLHKYLEDNHQNHKAWNALGIVCTKLKYFDDAADCYENALSLNPENAIYRKNLNINEKNRTSSSTSTQNTGSISDIFNDDYYVGGSKSNFDIIKGFLLKPKESFSYVKDTTWNENFIFIIPLVFVYSTLSGLIKFNFVNFIIVFFIIVGPIAVLIGIIINSLIIHAGVMIFGKNSNMGLNRTYASGIYSCIPLLLLGWIPGIGEIVGTLWSLLLLIIGLMVMHHLSIARAFLSIFGLLIIFGVIILFAFMSLGFVFGMAGVL
ncbi:YIP1 family protein [Methanospirillum sp. J.3.6.1-F.2.7.3]|uniref:YIP1 family protein n=1 Tax=Methanospirillum purgamenti TaxID=2834276 RepID=A0A8E7EHT7_9EURY|nr:MULTISPECIES: YIP1 family protein [Methanospirillum]MDX8551768.1 YIP1 family protein [Methanospirillum hungatei]QVV89713.1 YIP1 family protein [Methanospirillum sp. J.3.6.1-F.2.7.3]